MRDGIHKIGAHAMATEFQIYVAGTNEAKAMAAASAALRDLETLESELSRFKRNSDISRINHLQEGESTPIGIAALDCIQLAQDIHIATDGAFDITIGPLVAVLTNPDHSPRDPSKEELSKAINAIGINKIKLDHETLTATVLCDDIWLDLGGIGKGYALDQMALILKESGEKIHYEIDAFRKKCLLEGLDDIGLTFQKLKSIDNYEERLHESHPWII